MDSDSKERVPTLAWTQKNSQEELQMIEDKLEALKDVYEYDSDDPWKSQDQIEDDALYQRDEIKDQVHKLTQELESVADRLLFTEKELLAKKKELLAKEKELLELLGLAEEPVSPEQESSNPPCFWHHSDLAQAAGSAGV